MRVGALVLSAAVLVCALAYGFFLFWHWDWLPQHVPAVHYVYFVVLLAPAFVILHEAARPARRRRGERPQAPAAEPLWSACAIGVAAWFFVLVHFAPWRWIAWIRGLGPVTGSLLVVTPTFLLFSIGIGVLALGRAKSRRAKWIVALADFSAPLGYAAWLLAG